MLPEVEVQWVGPQRMGGFRDAPRPVVVVGPTGIEIDYEEPETPEPMPMDPVMARHLELQMSYYSDRY